MLDVGSWAFKACLNRNYLNNNIEPMKIYLTFFLTILLLLSNPLRAQSATISEDTFATLDKVRDNKKQQLLTYLNSISTNANAIKTDEYMLNCFNALNGFFKLQKKAPAPTELKEAMENLENCTREHYMRKYLAFKDILFINTDGDIFFTIRKEPDFQKNIFTGELSKTTLAKRLKESTNTDFVDYEYYVASGEPAAFFVEPIISNGQPAGWLVLQCNLRKINAMFTQEEELGATGEVFLVNKEQTMLTDSRFFRETSILKRHLSPQNIASKFEEHKGHKTVRDYRGCRALSSFEVCTIKNTEWLLITKIDEDEIITDAYRKNKKNMLNSIEENLAQQKASYSNNICPEGNRQEVEIDSFCRTSDEGEILFTRGLSTCTGLIATYPGKFAYMTHLSNRDQSYGGKETDLTAHIIKRIKNFDIYKHERRNLQFTIVARHLESIGNLIDKLVDEGFFLSQINFIFNPDITSRYGNVTHDYTENSTTVTWVPTDNAKQPSKMQNTSDAVNIGTLAKTLTKYDMEQQSLPE